MATLAQEPQQQSCVSFKNILLATDFSDASENALRAAVAIARCHGSKIYLLHVILPKSDYLIAELPRSRLRRKIQQDMKTLAGRSELQEIAHETVLRVGTVWSVLSAVIHEQNIDLVVLGTHGRGGIKKLVLGSVAEEVVRKASCPVITVGPDVDVPSSMVGELHSILFATDFHPASTKALAYALLLANEFQAKLILLHLMPPAASPGPGRIFYHEKAVNEWQAKVRTTIKERLEKLLPPGATLRSEPEYVVGFDFIADGVLKVAAERNADLIIMGATRTLSAKASSHVPRTVTHEVICHAKCPVLTVSA